MKHSFDLLNLPQFPVLDRFHVARAVHSAFSKLTNSRCSWTLSSPNLLRRSNLRQILELINQSKGKQTMLLKHALNYLENNQQALLDLEHRLPSDLKSATLGCAEANVDKLVRQRMRGRGFSWSVDGAQAMLAVLRHKDSLSGLSFTSPRWTAKIVPPHKTCNFDLSTYLHFYANISFFRGV